MRHILLIEDDVEFRAIVRRQLEQMGLRVTEAGDGREGLERLGQVCPDLVLTDIYMPEMDGIETIMKLRQNSLATKIVAMSGGGRWRNNANLNIVEKLGVRVSLAKPFSTEQLKHVIEQVLAEA